MRVSALVALVVLPACILVVDDGDLPNNRPNQSALRSENLPIDMAELLLDLPAGSVDIQVGSAPGLEAILSWRGDVADEPSLETVLDGDRASYLWSCVPRSNCVIDLTLTVPPTMRSTTVLVDAGDVGTEGLTGDLNIALDAGNVTVTGHTGSVDLSVDAGTIRGTDLCSEIVTAATNAGDVDLGLCQRPIEVVATTDVGDVDLAVPAGDYALDIAVDVGNVDVSGITEDAAADASLTARTNVGDIRIQGS